MPAADPGALGSGGGAYINVFTRDSSEPRALNTASREVAQAGWRVKVVDKVSWVTREDYSDDPAGLEYFEQALIDGIVVVVHTFPATSDEETIQ